MKFNKRLHKIIEDLDDIEVEIACSMDRLMSVKLELEKMVDKQEDDEIETVDDEPETDEIYRDLDDDDEQFESDDDEEDELTIETDE